MLRHADHRQGRPARPLVIPDRGPRRAQIRPRLLESGLVGKGRGKPWGHRVRTRQLRTDRPQVAQTPKPPMREARGVVENRILEAGDMATPATPVFTIALTNPVWARAYVPETDLSRVAPGMHAAIENSDLPGRQFSGWIGYISPTAEFTPKTVETTELRSQLVYSVRVYACNPTGALRLGMPVTVVIPRQDRSAALPAHPCRS